MSKPVVAIVGRPNVGKSTIFNRLAGQRIAIVEDKPGITRDRIYSTGEWLDHSFHIIDTGGIEVGSKDQILLQIRQQADLAIAEADVIIFMVDGKAGVTEADKEIASLLYKTKKPVVLAVNKIDNIQMQNEIYDFYALGFDEPYPISGAHGIGLGDLLDAVIQHFPSEDEDAYPDDVIRVAIIGRPNVGKSSLVNAILGEERVIVSDMAGTTRDAVDTPFSSEDQDYVLVDTAGMRKRGKVYETTEKYSVLRAMKAIEDADVVLIVIDGHKGIIEQDKRIAGYAHEAGRASIFIVNKWDIVEKDDKTLHQFEKSLRDNFLFMSYAPVLFVSAKTKQRVRQILPKVNEVSQAHNARISTSVLNDIIRDAIAINPPPTDKGRKLKIKYVTQVSVRPPTFIIFVNDTEIMHFSYERFLENKIRDSFNFDGTPIKLIIRQKKEK